MDVLKVFLVFISRSFTQDVPFKPSNEFEAAVDLQFKSRPAPEGNSFDANGNKIAQQSGTLPFLSVNLLHISTTKEESRFKATDSNGKNFASKKLSPNTSYHFAMGFIAD